MDEMLNETIETEEFKDIEVTDMPPEEPGFLDTHSDTVGMVIGGLAFGAGYYGIKHGVIPACRWIKKKAGEKVGQIMNDLKKKEVEGELKEEENIEDAKETEKA